MSVIISCRLTHTPSSAVTGTMSDDFPQADLAITAPHPKVPLRMCQRNRPLWAMSSRIASRQAAVLSLRQSRQCPYVCASKWAMELA